MKFALALNVILFVLLLITKAQADDLEIADHVAYAHKAELTDSMLRIHITPGTLLTDMNVSNVLIVEPLFTKEGAKAFTIAPEQNLLVEHQNTYTYSTEDRVVVYRIILALVSTEVLEVESFTVKHLRELTSMQEISDWQITDGILDLDLDRIPKHVQSDLQSGEFIIAAGNEVGNYSFLVIE